MQTYLKALEFAKIVHIINERVRIQICIHLAQSPSPQPPGHCCCASVTKLCPTICDPMDCSTLGLPVFHSLLEFAQIHVQ